MKTQFRALPGNKQAPGLSFQGFTRSGIFVKEDGSLWVSLDGASEFPLVKPLTDLELQPGDILYVNSDSDIARLPIGSDGQILKIVSGLPSWEDDV